MRVQPHWSLMWLPRGGAWHRDPCRSWQRPGVPRKAQRAAPGVHSHHHVSLRVSGRPLAFGGYPGLLPSLQDLSSFTLWALVTNQ